MHSTSAFKPPSASRTTRDETVHILIYGYNSKEAVWATPQQPGLIEPNKPSEKKGAYPKMSLTPANISTGARVSTGTHSHPASMLAWPLCSPGAHIPPGVRLAQCPISPGARVSTGTHTSTMLVFHSTPCSPDGRVSSNAHAHLVLMFHPILKGNRSDTYRARTSGTTPWQESCSMHDFEAPDVK